MKEEVVILLDVAVEPRWCARKPAASPGHNNREAVNWVSFAHSLIKRFSNIKTGMDPREAKFEPNEIPSPCRCALCEKAPYILELHGTGRP